MPSKSPAQARLMAAAANSQQISRRAGVPQSVANEFNKADAKSGILRKRIKKAVKNVPDNKDS